MAASTNGTARALVGGAVGASVLTALHESVRRVRPDAPRMDVLGMRVLGRTMRKMGRRPPERDRLHTITLIGDLLGNGLYFALVGAGGRRGVWKRGLLLGLAAGIGGVLLPPIMGLGSRPSARTTETKLMTVAWYTIGGIAAAAAAQLFRDSEHPVPIAQSPEPAATSE